MPFYFVQLAPYNHRKGDTPLAEMWEAQSAVAAKIPYTGMAVINDIGNVNNIHPKNKQDVGKRLALLALKNDYGKDVISMGPVYAGQSVQGSSIHLTFKEVGSGIVSRDGKALSHFQIAGIDAKFVPAKAVIEGNKTIVVSSDLVSKPVFVRFAWHDSATPYCS